jgi:Fe-S cluster biogenesis protein NfuA
LFLFKDFFASGQPIVIESEVAQDTAPNEGDSEVVSMIKEILETRVRPAVQEDGGDIEYKAFEQGVVFIKMQGSCSGCPTSSVTLKGGIERILTHWIPEGKQNITIEKKTQSNKHYDFNNNSHYTVQSVVALDDDDLDKLNLEAFKKTEQKISST